MSTSDTKGAASASSMAPFGYPTFTILWIATVVSNVGVWMQNAASGWLMTGLDPDPFTVSLVQVAGSLPMFLFALPAGALADTIDRRRLLVAIQTLTALLVGGFGFMVWGGQVTPTSLLVFSFLAATAAALNAPAWQAIVPQLVPRDTLQPAVALNSVGFNVSRAVGPALAGVIIAVTGLAAPFWINALTTIGVVAALVWWRPPSAKASRLPSERFWSAVRAGLRHSRSNPDLQATLIRAGGFFVFASAYWALLPLVARDQIAGGPKTVRRAAWRHWRQRSGWRISPAAVEAQARRRQGDGGWHHRHDGRDDHVRCRTGQLDCVGGESCCRIVVDRGAGDDQRLGPGCLAGMGARPRTFDLRNGDVW